MRQLVSKAESVNLEGAEIISRLSARGRREAQERLALPSGEEDQGDGTFLEEE